MTLPVDTQLKPVYPLNNNWNDTKKDKKLNTYNIIPENCFGCFKVQIQPKNIIDFLKLYLVFDNLKLKKT